MEKPRIVYMGTPEFAVAPLQALMEAGYPVISVVTVPDKPAGRGQKITPSAVKAFAKQNDLPILQPLSLRDREFLNQLHALHPDLIIVVAFRILPREVFTSPPLGTFNLHASLLPAYRGAAPIQRAIMNGETQTGLTTFLLDEGIDTGKILFQRPLQIGSSETAGELHDRMMLYSPEITLATVEFLWNGIVPQNSDLKLVNAHQPVEVSNLPTAPKILKDDCQIHWNNSTIQIYNQIRGLSPYPAAFTIIQNQEGITLQLKIFSAEMIQPHQVESSGLISQEVAPGTLLTDKSKLLIIKTKDGFLKINEVQLQGKKRLSSEEFLRGFRMETPWHAC
ncbi:MAG: methionyl-tRNA formyltransferase [Bacteroidales bacterium]